MPCRRAIKSPMLAHYCRVALIRDSMKLWTMADPVTTLLSSPVPNSHRSKPERSWKDFKDASTTPLSRHQTHNNSSRYHPVLDPVLITASTTEVTFLLTKLWCQSRNSERADHRPRQTKFLLYKRGSNKQNSTTFSQKQSPLS